MRKGIREFRAAKSRRGEPRECQCGRRADRYPRVRGWGETIGLSHEERIFWGREGAVGGSLRSHSKEAWAGGSEILPIM